MVDGDKGFMKDGNKNRLRERDIHQIVDVFNKQTEIPGYSKIVSFAEIEKNEFNLNIPRYIDSSEAEDLQDIEAHLLGDIPAADIHALQNYWDVLPGLQATLFQQARRSKNYLSLQVAKDDIRQSIFQHPEFVGYMDKMNQVFSCWAETTIVQLKNLQNGHHPKEVIHSISTALLNAYTDKPLINRYAVYQHLMNYWSETMQDDCYLIAADGWQATTCRIIETNKKGKEIDKGWTCDLIPKSLVINRYFADEQQAIDDLSAALEGLQSQKDELVEEQSGEDGAFAELEKINKTTVNARIKELKNDPDAEEEAIILRQYIKLLNQEAATKKAVKAAVLKLDNDLLEFYPTLTEEQIKQLVVDDKWLATIATDIHSEMDRLSQRLTGRIKELAERYETPLPEQSRQVADYEKAVQGHLEEMGFKI
jgi:type I restriction enzyme M protein